MPKVGSLGDIPFLVDSSTVIALNNLQWSGSVRYGEHRLHLGPTLLEYTGQEPMGGSFDLTLSSELGVNVMSLLDKIDKYTNRGKVMPLVVGSSSIGRRWIIKSYKASAKYYDKRGNISVAVVSITLMQYN